MQCSGGIAGITTRTETRIRTHRLMRLHRVAWLSATLLTAAVGAVGTAAMMPRERAMATIVTMAFSGGFLGVAFACQADADLWRAASNGALLCAAASLIPGLLHAVGHAGYALVSVLIISAPAVSMLIEQLLRGRILRSRTQAAEDALRRQWVESGVRLRNATSAEDQLSWVEARSNILDELTAHSGGELPSLLWDAVDRPDAPSR